MGTAKISFLEAPPDSITINKKTKTEIIKQIEKASMQTLAEEMEGSWEELQREAQNFIDSYYGLVKQSNKIALDVLKAAITPQDPTTISYINMKASNQQLNILRAKYLLATRFEEYLDNFREKKLPREMIYAQEEYENNAIKINLFKMSTRELIFNADKEGRFKFEKNAPKRISKWREDEQKLLKPDKLIDPEDHAIEAAAAYNGTYNRTQRYFEIVNKKSANEQQKGLLLWKTNGEWKGDWIGNKGVIKEAYTAFLFSKHKNIIEENDIGNPNYYNHPFIEYFYENFLKKVSSLAAIIEEDVITNWTQYGIKSKNAALPGLTQYLTVAIEILKHNKMTSKELNEEIPNWLPKEIFFSTSKTLQEIGEELPKGVLQKIFNELR